MTDTSQNSGTSDSYAKVLGTRRVKPLIAAGVVGRLAYGVVPFAIVVAFAERHGFGVAGIASAVLMTGIALLGPWRGRQIDRYGTNAVLLFATVWVVALGLLAAFLGHLPWPVSLVLIAVAGALAPPVSPVLRTSWSRLLPDKQQLQRIHALDSVIEETTFVVAPLLTTTMLTLTSARWALVLGAGLIAVAVPMLTSFGHLPLARPPPRPKPPTEKLTGQRARPNPLLRRASGSGRSCGTARPREP